MGRRFRVQRTAVLLVSCSVPMLAAAQFGAGYGPPLVTVPPPREFATSHEHYAWLLEQKLPSPTYADKDRK